MRLPTASSVSQRGHTTCGPAAVTYTLPNGLHVVLLEDHSAPVVALQTWVRFGSADEEPPVAGIAHVFEHMLFKGTERFPHGEISAIIEGAGGVVNAWTNYDETVYHVTLSSRFWETGFDMLSDAMLHSVFDTTELEREKEVVLEEFWQSKDSPDREVAERLFALTYSTHPYRRPIIGFEDTVTGISRDDMLRVFHTWYAPNNMIVVAVGDFDPQTMRQAVEERFGRVAMRALPTRPRWPEPVQTTPRVLAFPFAAELARVEVALPAIAATDPRVPALDLLSDVLGSGYNSTLYTALKRRRDLAHDVYAFNYTPCDPGVFLLGASCPPEHVADVVRELMQPIHHPALAISEHDLDAAKTRIVSQFVHARETYQGIAEQLGRFALVYGEANYGSRYVAAIESLTRDDLQHAAAAFFDPQRINIALLMPQNDPLPETKTIHDWVQPTVRQRFHGTTTSASATVRTIPLPGGSTLIVQTDRKAPLVTVRTLVAGGQRAEAAGKEGLARLLTTVWDRGTTLRSAAEIERELDRLGAALQATSDRDSLQLMARFLRETFATGLDLYFEILTEPAFPTAEVERERQDQWRDIETLKEHRFQYAMQHFLATFYGDHPYNHLAIGTPDGVASITRDDLLACHQTLLHPQRTVHVIVGDISAEEALTLWERLAPARLFESPQTSPLPAPPVPAWSQACTQVVELDGQQTHIIWGFPTITGRHPDRFALHVLDTILGGTGGRLFTELRDRKSLAYAVTSFDAYPVDRGFLALYIGCSPEKEAEALAEFERVVHDIHSAGVTPEELTRAKTYLAGVLDISLQSTSQRTAVYGSGMLHHGQWDVYKEYLQAVNTVSQSDIQRVAQTYLQPACSLRTILRGKR